MRMRLDVKGTVQGVGFRPFVHREATRLAITGWVRNSEGQVEIEAQAPRVVLDRFVARLRSAPPPAQVGAVTGRELPERSESNFEIVPSRTSGTVLPSLPADLAPCAECCAEMADPRDRRHGYPFIACARCGPRYSIVRAMPYDRASTSMADFPLCAECAREYADPNDRRFHAESIACPACGPSLEFLDGDARSVARGAHALDRAVSAIDDGLIVALRGVGGFQLIVDATSESAVQRLRARKHRDDKPFAVLFSSVDDVRRDAVVNALEGDLLAGPAGPIVLLDRIATTDRLASAVAPQNPQVGSMLPTSPLHRLLAGRAKRPLVCTSGNVSGEPLAVDTAEAIDRLAGVADAFLTHDRPMARPLDDSVARVESGHTEILRRARGYAPSSVAAVDTSRVVLALGAHMKATVALVTGGQLVLGQHVGDLDDRRTLAAFERATLDLLDFFGAVPDTVACDLHPDYASSIVARELAAKMGARLVQVQHHHAHVAAVAAEHRIAAPALGIAWDGTGLGDDGTTWGSEFLLFDGARFRRFAHLAPYKLPGGDRAAREPWRSAIGTLAAIDRDLAERIGRRWLPQGELRAVLDAIDRGVNAPETSSMGRMFDAVAAVTGLRARCTFEGQAAMELEFHARTADPGGAYPLPIRDGGCLVGEWAPLMTGVLDDLARDTPRAVVAARFHATLVDFAVRVAERAGREHVILGGGCLQNRLLARGLRSALAARGHRVFTAAAVPCNDGGISAGQAYIAALLEPG